MAFDGEEKLPFNQSVARWGMDLYFRSVLDTEAVQEVKNVSELLDAVNAYLIDPLLQKKERELLRQKFCFKIDGHSGERFAKIVIDTMEKYNG